MLIRRHVLEHAKSSPKGKARFVGANAPPSECQKRQVLDTRDQGGIGSGSNITSRAGQYS